MSEDGKAPGFWFYPADYERDVQILSLESQGLWMRMLCWMSENESRRGFLELPNGQPMNSIDIARKVGGDVRTIRKLLRELEHFGIFSVLRVGIVPSTGKQDFGLVFNRRMVRDTHISSVRRKAANARYKKVESVKHEYFPEIEGQICSTFAPAIAPAIAPAKTLQNASVTVTDTYTPPTPPLNAGGKNGYSRKTTRAERKEAAYQSIMRQREIETRRKWEAITMEDHPPLDTSGRPISEAAWLEDKRIATEWLSSHPIGKTQ
jgi:hypothetical protein